MSREGKIAALIFAVCAFAVAALFLLSREDRPIKPGEGVRGAGLVAAKQVITPMLNDPASADFEWSSVRAQRLPNKEISGKAIQRWRVTGIVRAQNAFGGVVPERWEAWLAHDGTQFFASRVMLGERVVFTTPTAAVDFSEN